LHLDDRSLLRYNGAMPRKKQPEDEMALNSFFAAIDNLGATEVERARALGITDRQLLTWRKGGVPRVVKRLAQNPRLLDALRADGDEFVTKQTSQGS
jgi:hypothetical protein